MRRPCMSVKATTTVSTSPLATRWARSSFVTKGSAACLGPAASPGDEALEEPARPRQVGRQLLRVTLHRNDKPVIGLHAFDRAVLALRCLVQSGRQAADRLVVEAVDAHLVLAGGLAQLGRRVDLDGVGQVAAAEAANIVVVEVLHKRPSKSDVDHLLAATDAEHGDRLLPSLLEQAELGLVQLAVDRPGLVVLLLAVERRVYIPPAGQQEAVHVRQRPRARRELDGLCARRLHRLPIRQGVRLPPAAGPPRPRSGVFIPPALPPGP